jgi:hypothetical protein
LNLAETLVPLLPLTPAGSMTLKADHPRRVWELDETYHAAQQTSFRRHNMAANKTTFLFCPRNPLTLGPRNPGTLEIIGTLLATTSTGH